MNALIPIRHCLISEAQVQTVNARELHAFLEIRKDFSSWIKAQIERARLLENRDFTKLTQKGGLACIGQTRIDYFLTIESAKHISMLSGTEKGFEVREYFIECERQAKEAVHRDPIQILNDPAAMRGLLLTYMRNEEILKAPLRRTV